MVESVRSRSAQEVFDGHLRLEGEHRFSEDIDRNLSADCVLLERRGVFRGRDGADSFLIEDGWILARTIHHAVETG